MPINPGCNSQTPADRFTSTVDRFWLWEPSKLLVRAKNHKELTTSFSRVVLSVDCRQLAKLGRLRNNMGRGVGAGPFRYMGVTEKPQQCLLTPEVTTDFWQRRKNYIYGAEINRRRVGHERAAVLISCYYSAEDGEETGSPPTEGSGAVPSGSALLDSSYCQRGAESTSPDQADLSRSPLTKLPLILCGFGFFPNLPSALISLTRLVKRAQRDAHLAEHPAQRSLAPPEAGRPIM